MEMQWRCNGVPLRTSDGFAHQVRRCEPACVPSTPDTYVGSRLERLDRTPGRCGHASAHHGAISSPHRYVGSRSLEPTPRALGARARERLELPATVMDEAALRAKLQPYAQRRHLHFASLRPEGFSVRLSAVRRGPFDETIRHLGGGFCCVEAERRGGFGHFWYTLFFCACWPARPSGRGNAC